MYRRLFVYIVIALVLFVAPYSMSLAFRNATARALAPITKVTQRQRIGISTFFTTLSQIGSLRSDKAALQEQVVNLQQQLSDAEQLKRENEALQQELGVKGVAQTLPKLFAHVIVQGSDPLDRTFTLDAGSNQGVRLGQPVVSGGYLVGRIIEVRSGSSRVRSILSAQSVIQAWMPTLNDKGLLVGEGNTASLQKITQGLSVPDATVVETSGLHSDTQEEILPLPQGILIGTTAQRLSKDSDLTQSFRVQTTIDPSTLESVLILLTDAS